MRFSHRNFFVMNYRHPFSRHRLALFVFVSLAFTLSSVRSGFAKHDPLRNDPPPQGIDFSVVVYDGTNHQPLELARVGIYHGSALVKGKVTDPEGRAHFTDMDPGVYKILVWSVGYNTYADSTFRIDEAHTFDSITMFETGK